MADESDAFIRTEARRVDYACKGSAVKGAELLAVEPNSEGLCGADICFRDWKEKRFK